MLVNRFYIAEYKRSFGMLAEGFNRASNRPWVIEIIRVEPANDLPCRFGKAFVDSVCLPAVFL